MNIISGTVQGVGRGKQLEWLMESGYTQRTGFVQSVTAMINRQIIAEGKIFCVELERTKISPKMSRVGWKNTCARNTKAVWCYGVLACTCAPD